MFSVIIVKGRELKTLVEKMHYFPQLCYYAILVMDRYNKIHLTVFPFVSMGNDELERNYKHPHYLLCNNKLLVDFAISSAGLLARLLCAVTFGKQILVDLSTL